MFSFSLCLCAFDPLNLSSDKICNLELIRGIRINVFPWILRRLVRSEDPLKVDQQKIQIGNDSWSMSSLSCTDCVQPTNLPFSKIGESVAKMVFP